MNFASSKVSDKAAVLDSPGDSVRILHLNAGNLYGGVETLLVTMARLRDLCPGMEPYFGVCYEGRMSQELRESDVPVHNLGAVRLSRPWTIWRARRSLRELLRREPVDVVVCHMAWSWVIFGGTARAAGRRVILWMHGFASQEGWLDRAARRRTPDFVIANSRSTSGAVREQFPSAPMQIIYYPVALVAASEAAQWRSAARNEERVEDDTVVILQVGRMEPWKGHLVHLRALARLQASRKWICWVAGGPQTPGEEQHFTRLKETAEQLGIADRVRFLGQRTDVPKLLAAADIFCQPNQGPEPFGLVFVEALWAGRPVVSSALGGAQEIVDASCGLLATPGDPDSLSKALLSLIESRDMRERLGEAGPARARQLCDPARQMRKLKDVFAAEAARRRNS